MNREETGLYFKQFSNLYSYRIYWDRGRQAFGYDPMALKKILLGHNFFFLMEEDSILLRQPWVAGLGAVQL